MLPEHPSHDTSRLVVVCDQDRERIRAVDPEELQEHPQLKRGFILSGKRIDYQRCARTVMDEFRSGKTGRITLEKARTV